MTQSQHAPAPSPFFHPDGPFHLGEPHALPVVARDYPTEFSAVQYLGLATRGQPIAVGWLALAYLEGNVGTHQSIGMAIVPGRGIWVIIPVFDEWDWPREAAAEAWWMLDRVIGDRLDAAMIRIAYVPTLADQVPRGEAPDPASVYDTTVFVDAANVLRPAPEATPARVDAAIAELLEAGDWGDEKHESTSEDIPRWLAELLNTR